MRQCIKVRFTEPGTIPIRDGMVPTHGLSNLLSHFAIPISFFGDFESRHFDLLAALFKFLGRLPAGIICASRSSSDLSLSFLYSVSGVVFRIVLIIGAVIRDAANHFFGVIAAGEGAI